MNLTDKQKRYLGWAVVVLAIVFAGYLGYYNPVPPAPEEGAEARAVERGALLCATESGNCVESWSGADLIGYSDEGSTRTFLIDGAAGNVDVEGTGNFAGALTLQAGLALSGGVLDLNDAIDIDGSADEVQLAVTGYTTQTSDLVQFDGGLTDIGSGTYGAADGDNDLGVAGDLEVNGELQADGSIDANDNIDQDGVADEVQLSVTGYTTQTSNIFLVEQSGGTDLFWVDNNGDVELNGTTPTLTMGDAGEEDTQINFDGNAQDFHIGLDDTADDLVVGVGTALGTTTAFAVDENQVTTWSGGTIKLTEAASSADTITASECGKTFFMSGNDYTLTLPAVSTVSAGCEFRFIISAAPTTSTVVLTGNTDEDVLIGGINELEVDTNDDGPYDASADTITFVGGTAALGDFVYMISDGSFFYVSGQANADGGVTITDSD